MKDTTAIAKAMSDDALHEMRAYLAREIPEAQGLYDAIRREHERRRRARRMAKFNGVPQCAMQTS